MGTKVKIKIMDNQEIRNAIDALNDEIDQIILAKWSIQLVKHILESMEMDKETLDEIKKGFRLNEQWQLGKLGVHQVRQAAFAIHKLARESDDEVKKTVLRAVGHAIASGHVKEHAMVASDYAIKAIGLIHKNDEVSITSERQWQLMSLKK
jgi:hypothetical protein